MNERQVNDTVKMQEGVAKVGDFKCLGSIESTCRMEWLEKSVRSDLQQESTSWSERDGVQGGSVTSNVVRVWDGGTDEKTGGGDGGGRVEDVTSDMNGQNQEWVHQRDGTGGTVWRENTRGETEVVWTCTEERWRVYREKDAEDGVAEKEEMRKAKKDVYGCGERGHGSGWNDGEGYRI